MSLLFSKKHNTFNKDPQTSFFTGIEESDVQNSVALSIANKALAFQYAEKEKRASELEIANRELIFQNGEKEDRAAELIIANEELIFQKKEKKDRASELALVNKELIFQNREKEKRASELLQSNKELKKTEEILKEYIHGLEEMMFMTSHRVRQPIAQIIGITEVLNQSAHSVQEIEEMMGFIKKSALTLDIFTRDLTVFMSNLGLKGKNKRWNKLG